MESGLGQDRPGGRSRKLLPGRSAPLALALLILLTAGGAAGWLYSIDRYTFLYFGDAASHIVKSREFTDSHGLWFHYLGTVWLPLPHLLLAPFTAVDAFFFTGLAGPLVGIPCLAGTGLLLFLTIRGMTGSTWIAFLCAALFGLNPNVVYMALTPMNEPSLIFFVALGGYALYRWLNTHSRAWLLFASASVMLASLCRYEAWLLAPYLTILAAAAETGQWRQSTVRTMLRVLAVAAISSAGILFWLAWNYAEFGGPLAFLQGTYGVIPDSFRESRQRMPLFILYTFARAVLTIFGPFLLYVAARGMGMIRGKGEHRTNVLVLAYFMLPALFIFGSVMAGYVGIDEWWWNWRYVLTLGLFLAVAGGIGLAAIVRKGSPLARRITLVGLAVMPFVQLAVPEIGVATFKDAAKCISGPTPSAIAVGEELQEMYTHGSIGLLTGHGQAQRIMVSSWLPLRRFDVFPEPTDEMDIRLNGEQFLVFAGEQTPESEQPIRYWRAHRAELLRSFEICREDDYFILLRRMQDSRDDPAVQAARAEPRGEGSGMGGERRM